VERVDTAGDVLDDPQDHVFLCTRLIVLFSHCEQG
jgi:hypothetical protein